MGTVKPIKVNHKNRHVEAFDESLVQSLIKNTWERTDNPEVQVETSFKKTRLNPPKTKDNKETVVSATLDWKLAVIALLMVFLAGSIIGWYILGGRERLISEKEDLKYSNWVQNQTIDRANRKIDANNKRIEEVDTLLITKYKTKYE